MSTCYVMPVNDNILNDTNVDFSKVIALYGDGNTFNIGYPTMAAYKPRYANMWGYNEAEEKGLYIIIDDIENIDGTLYCLEVDDERKKVIKKELVTKKESSTDTNILEFDSVKSKRKVR